jgi:glycerophosphoryl diester phosphodiesterase
VIPYLSPAGLKIFAHRGSTEGGAIENTLEAFRFALDSGVRYLETDVQATSDGVAVLFHDTTLERVAGLKGKVSDYSFDRLSQISLGGVSRIPSLEETLARFPEAKWNLDLKTADAIQPAITAITKSRSQDRVLVSSFSRKRRLRALKGLPTVATSADATTILMLLLTHKLGLKPMFRELLVGLDALQIPTKMGPLEFDDQRFIKDVADAGVEIHFWTINDLQEAQRLVMLGAKGIVTDKGKMMVERLDQGQSK